jgi:Na+-driven multidrug efflux pump
MKVSGDTPQGDLDLDEDEEDLRRSLQEERERFERMSPLPSFLVLSIGPLLMQVGAALHDSIDFIEISRAYGSYGVGVVGLASLIRYFCEGISFVFGFAAIIKLPMLIGEGKQLAARQFIVDLYRVGFAMSIAFAIIVYFISEPMLRYMNCPEFMLPDSMTYITPICWSIPLFVLLQVSLGVVQGEGRAVLCGIIQLSVIVFNIGIISPITFFGIEASLKYSGYPYMLSRGIPAIIMVVLIFTGRFSLKPKLSLFTSPISSHVWDSLKLASSFLLFLLINVFPAMFMVHYFLLAAMNIGEFAVINPVFNTFQKINTFVFSWVEGFSQGFMAAGSYATGSVNIHRFVKLAFWGFIFCFVSQLIFMPLTLIDPWVPTSIWLSGDQERVWARRINGVPFYTEFLQSVAEITNCMCISAGNGWAPLVPAVVKGAIEIGGVYGLYSHGDGETNPKRILHIYNILDCCVLVLDIMAWIFIILPYIKRQMSMVQNGETGPVMEGEKTEEEDQKTITDDTVEQP